MSALALLALPFLAAAAEKGQGGMPAMKMEGTKEGHGGMMKMGDKVFGGRVGPWQGEARLMDMKAHMEKVKASGMKIEGMMKNHHIAFGLTDPKTKKPVTEGKGTVTVVGPDKKEEKSDFMAMEGHFGADVNLPRPGKYTFKVSIESGGRKGSATFSYAVK
jgi:translation elongation factor EF-1beta